jgi:aryl-alcohol dehydrogenase-like predicted oxidoreductase
MNRMPEVEHFPACFYYGLGIVPYSPLARGVLTGNRPAPRPTRRRARPRRQAHDADRMAAGIPAARASDHGTPKPAASPPPVRGVMGAELRRS